MAETPFEAEPANAARPATATTVTARRRDWPGAVGGVLAIAVGAGAIWAASDYSDLGAVFPRSVGGLLVLLGVLTIGWAIAGRGQAPAALDGSTARRVGVAVVMLAWGFAMPLLGFLASSAAAMALLLVLANHHRWSLRTGLVHGLSVAVVLLLMYALFKHALLVPLP